MVSNCFDLPVVALSVPNEPEWGFSEPPDKVDLEQIWAEVSAAKAVFAFAYMGELRKRAPRTYARLGEWAKANKRMTWWNWEADHDQR